MISEALLEKIGFSPEDISLLLSYNAPCAHGLDALAAEYMSENGMQGAVPYTHEEFTQKRARVQSFLLRAREQCSDYSAYTADLLFWLHCVPHAEKYYRKQGIIQAVFWESMYDLVCKTQMCKKNYGIIGVYIDWFYLIFDYQVFALGRLQFYAERFEADRYEWGDFVLQKGDPVYSCHIPANGPLDTEACMESFQRAYEFFKDRLDGSVIPITCESWLLYPPYIEKVFVKNSNMTKFAALFDIIHTQSTGSRFLDARNVFGRYLDGSTETLPRDTALQRNFLDYIASGEDFGNGYGVILYDGSCQRILNK